MARLDCLTIQGFKSIRSLEDFELRGLNVLIGPNGVSKSNLLSLFRLLDHLSRERLQLFVKQEGGPDALLFGGRRRSSSMSVELSFDGGRCRYRFSLKPAANTLVFADEWVFPCVADFLVHIAPGTFATVDGGTTWTGGHEEACLARMGQGAFASDVLPGMQRWRVFHFADISAGRASRVRLPQAVRDNIRLRQDAANLSPFLRHLHERHPDHYRRIVETVRLAAPFFGDFVHRQDHETGEAMVELKWSHADDPDSVFGPFQLSDGTLRFVCLATLLLQPTELQPGVILIDEPELGLHPYALTLLAEMLQHASDERQVIVSTQSADLISELEPEDMVVVDCNDGASAFTRLDRDSMSDWLEDYSLGDLWKMNVLGGRPGPRWKWLSSAKAGQRMPSSKKTSLPPWLVET